MNLLLPNPPVSVLSACGIAGIAAATFVAVKLTGSSKLDTIPTVGSTSWLGSWWAGLKFLNNAADVIQEGYEKHKSAPFKVATLYYWIVVLNGREYVEEMRRESEDVLSFMDAIKDRLQLEYTMGAEIHHNPYHISILHSQLTRNLGALYPEIRNEVVVALDDVLNLSGNEWKSMLALSSIQKVICRTSNRVFVGFPLCRDPDWIDLNIRYTIDIARGGIIIGLFPGLLRPIAAWLLTSVNQSNQRGRKLAGPIIEERRKYLNEYGNEWTNKPDDLLSWLMEKAEGPELSVESLTIRLLAVNFVSIHAASRSFTQALFYLAANPQYIRPLRKEVESIIEKEGWSKTALAKMRKVDSFLKECQRIEGIGSVSMMRKALKDFTFSDGTFIPKGTIIVTATQSVHLDEAVYKNAEMFEPFRFADLHEEGGDNAKHQYVSTTAEYLAFGYGRQACPGRFFAGVELKTMLAHIVVTYDVKLEENATRPQSLRFAQGTTPDPSAKVMFRKRVD